MATADSDAALSEAEGEFLSWLHIVVVLKLLTHSNNGGTSKCRNSFYTI